MLFNSYSYEILHEQFYRIYLQGDVKLLLVTVNNRLKFEIEIVYDLSCHPIFSVSLPSFSCPPCLEFLRPRSMIRTLALGPHKSRTNLLGYLCHIKQ